MTSSGWPTVLTSNSWILAPITSEENAVGVRAAGAVGVDVVPYDELACCAALIVVTPFTAAAAVGGGGGRCGICIPAIPLILSLTLLFLSLSVTHTP